LFYDVFVTCVGNVFRLEGGVSIDGLIGTNEGFVNDLITLVEVDVVDKNTRSRWRMSLSRLDRCGKQHLHVTRLESIQLGNCLATGELGELGESGERGEATPFI